MTKEEAKQLMFRGIKMRHRYFLANEWILFKKKNHHIVILDDGNEMDANKFWAIRNTPSYDSGWSMYDDIEYPKDL